MKAGISRYIAVKSNRKKSKIMFDKAKRKSILSICRTEEVSAENNISENNLKIVVDTDQARWYIIKARSERVTRQIFEN